MSFLLDLPLPRPLDLRPWRCIDCGEHFPVQVNDVRAKFPGVLRSTTTKQRTLWFAGPLLVQMCQKFCESFNAAAVKRFLMDLYACNCLSLVRAEQRLMALAAVPRLRSLRGLLREALASYLPPLVQHMMKSVHVYSGSAVKGDGNYKLAARVRGRLAF